MTATSLRFQNKAFTNKWERILRSKLSKRDLVNIVFLLAYVSTHIFLSFYHEAWRDESQAWVIARNASFYDILTLCASEGHPCLWFFFLKVCTILGISFYHFSLISVLIMAGAAALLLWKSPLSFLSNLCILLSPVFFYYNPVICRIYSIVVLLCTLLCAWWPQRRESPVVYGIIVAAIFQSHILMAGLAIGCLVEMIVYCKGHLKIKNIIGFLIPLASLICMILELRQTEQTETYMRISVDSMIGRLKGGKINTYFESVTRKFEFKGIPIGLIFVCISVLIAIIFLVCFMRNRGFRLSAKGIGIVSFCGIAYYWSVIFLVRSADHIQMAIVLWILVSVFVWLATKAYKTSVGMKIDDRTIADNEEKARGNLTHKRTASHVFEILFVFCCVLSIPQSVGIDAAFDVNGPFSGSREIVDLITDNAPENSVIALHNDLLSTSIVSYLYDAGKNYTLWDIDNGEEYTIHKWGRENIRAVDNESLYEVICSDVGDKESVYFVNAQQSLEFGGQASEQMVLTGQNSVPNIWNEYYQLYEVKMDNQ